MRDLIEVSFALHDRIVQLDRAMGTQDAATEQATPANPVANQMAVLEQAFGEKRVASR